MLDKENANLMDYVKPKNRYEDKDVIHWGQRKLFLSELWFLTHYGHLAKNVVYAGAASGTHIPFLVTLFPDHYFILVDPGKFKLKLMRNDTTKSEERIEVKNEFFTD